MCKRQYDDTAFPNHPNFIDLTGTIHGQFKVLDYAGKKQAKRGDYHKYWTIKCINCGSIKDAYANQIKDKKVACRDC